MYALSFDEPFSASVAGVDQENHDRSGVDPVEKASQDQKEHKHNGKPRRGHKISNDKKRCRRRRRA